jgi:hypothetical protein
MGQDIRRDWRIALITKEVHIASLLSLPEVAQAMRAYLRSNKCSMTAVLLAWFKEASNLALRGIAKASGI